jgi:hypothetical protein
MWCKVPEFLLRRGTRRRGKYFRGTFLLRLWPELCEDPDRLEINRIIGVQLSKHSGALCTGERRASRRPFVGI